MTYLEFVSTWERFDFDAAGNWTGRSELRQSISVSSSQEEFTGRSQTRIYDRSGTLTSTVNGTLRATRVNVRPIE